MYATHQDVLKKSVFSFSLNVKEQETFLDRNSTLEESFPLAEPETPSYSFAHTVHLNELPRRFQTRTYMVLIGRH
jgi:hypothetical protein